MVMPPSPEALTEILSPLVGMEEMIQGPPKETQSSKSAKLTSRLLPVLPAGASNGNSNAEPALSRMILSILLELGPQKL